MASWTPPPMPPMPTAQEEEAWRRRSTKRQSYTSQMTCGSMHNDPSRMSTANTEQDWRPISQISTTSTTGIREGRPPRRKPSKPEHDVYGDLHWHINPLNPRNWSKRKKWAHTLLAAAVTFTITLASSIVAPARQYLAARRDISSTVATLPFSIFVLALAFGPVISRCCNALFGRKIIYIVFVMLFAIFTLAAGLVNSVAGIIICRAIAGLLAGPALSQGGAMLAEIWAPEQRTGPMMFYDTTPLAGPVIGMVIGGYVRWEAKYDWTRYVVLFASAACIVPIVFISETSRPIIARRQREHTDTPPDRQSLRTDLFAPLRMLYSSPATLLLSLQSSYAFAILYASFVAFPGAFADAYSFGLQSQGLVFLSMLAGLAIGFLVLLLNHMLVYSRKVEQWQVQRAAEAEKARRTSARHRSAVSNFSRPNVKRNERTQSSTSMAPAHVSVSRPATSRSEASGLERNHALATAAADYLNRLEANKDNVVQSARIAAMLSSNIAFGELCVALEDSQLRFSKARLAQVLVDALPPSSEATPIPQRPALISSTSLHRSAAMAMIDEPAAEPSVPRLPRIRAAASEGQARSGPPAAWRLWPALPASLLSCPQPSSSSHGQ